MSEKQICLDFVTQLEQLIALGATKHLLYFEYCHIANERKTTLYRGHLFKRQGVRAGMPDYAFWKLEEKQAAFAFIEMKTPLRKNNLSISQREFKYRLVETPFIHYAVATSPNEAIDYLYEWGYLKLGK